MNTFRRIWAAARPRPITEIIDENHRMWTRIARDTFGEPDIVPDLVVTAAGRAFRPLAKYR